MTGTRTNDPLGDEFIVEETYRQDLETRIKDVKGNMK